MNVPFSSPSGTASPVMVSKVDHTGITVSSLKGALVFWVGVLGFRHLYTWEFENTFFASCSAAVSAVRSASRMPRCAESAGKPLYSLSHKS